MSNVLTKIRRHDVMRRLGKCLEKMAKTGLYLLLGVMSRKPSRASSLALVDVKRVLLVRPNFRLGNAVIGARLAEAFSKNKPEIRIDYLGTDTTVQLFSGIGISSYHAYSRTFSYRPWLFLRMIWELRRENYDLAIQIGEGSLTSWAFTHLCGAKKTLGQKGRLQNTYDWLIEGKTSHAYELPSAIAHSLGLHCESLPWMVVSEKEHARAKELFKHSSEGGVVGVFVGGHLDKRLPLIFWQAQIRELNMTGENYVVMVGPEEEHYRQHLEQCCGPQGQILPLMPIREFAAVLSHVITLITPDTGPMHMATALGVPVIALLNTDKSRKFCPKGIADKTLFRPTPTEVVAVLSGSPLIQSDRARKEHMLDRRMLLGSC
ncbi:MAG: glycosyl transferase [Salinicola sp.]|mgnify:CR=1 FL=1|nr:glycosyl transferase [Salinicola sp.]|tara:strand:+ start:1746 stop:2873 length:1128 start_codon:yes stop_codon:yes gene_type:complete